MADSDRPGHVTSRSNPMPDVSQLPRRLQLLDRGNALVKMLTPEQAQATMRSGGVEVIRRGGAVYALRWIEGGANAPPPVDRHPLRKRGYGDSHCQERRDNPKGVWTIDRIRARDEIIFRRVEQDCIGRRAA
ncbi:MAG TPA: hypothetical protein VMW52_07885 [Phycisphaerae bacterium]|nr:hypothetical protein [Phycisphaerae bacterium]